ncbi:MAG: GNAT family N-acetyltransferase [Firmicutes bacterium]|nr:GNAT family N-acetyltransferase [Bacillota bacterium]
MQMHTRLQALIDKAAATRWRGLAVIQAEPEVEFSWPTEALVLTGALNRYREHLGQSQTLVVVDMRHDLHADALAAAVQIVQGGGVAVCVVPSQTNAFITRLTSYLPPLWSLHWVCPSACAHTDLSNLTIKAPQTQTIELTVEQQDVLEALTAHIHTHSLTAPALLSAARGRGKSTVLGVLVQRLAELNRPVVVCAPSKRQLQALDAIAAQQYRFVAPDALATGARQEGIVIVDEAASLPANILAQIVQRYPGVIMATTNEGYETCGRGFLLNFCRQLKHQYPAMQQLSLVAPQRFAQGCPLETWLHQVLLLRPTAQPDISAKDASTAPRHYLWCHASTLSDPLLSQCFALLMDAHYQTSPNDLKQLLDSPNQQLCIQFADTDMQQVTAVAWLSEEGQLDIEISEQVTMGRRRPPGNLLAQSLSYYMQDPELATLLWLRVVRIAVAVPLQQQGLGSALLRHLLTAAHKRHYVAVGTSFASAPAINRFWRRHDFLPVRIGSKLDSTTARHSLVMLHCIAQNWRDRVTLWAAAFAYEFEAAAVLYQLSDEYVASLAELPNISMAAYHNWASARLQGFCAKHLDFANARMTLLQVLKPNLNAQPCLRYALCDLPLDAEFKRQQGVTGRRQLHEKVRQICLALHMTI